METKKSLTRPPTKGIRTDRVLLGLQLVLSGTSYRKAAAEAGCTPEAIRKAKIANKEQAAANLGAQEAA